MVDKSDHDLLVEIHGAVMGYNGQGGLLRDHDSLAKDYYNFKRWVLIIVTALVCSGGLSAGVIALIKHI